MMRNVSLKDIPPIRLHISFVALFVIYAVYVAATSGVYAFVNTCILFFLLFASVLLHELGHSFKALKLGYETKHITLYPFGGVAAIGANAQNSTMQDSPSDELKIAFAGPLVNLYIFLFSIPFAYAFDVPFLRELMIINFVMGVFNLFPAFPMDGGRILRSGLSIKVGHKKATVISLILSATFSVLFIIVGFLYNLPMLPILGIILLLTIRQEFTRLNRVKFTSFLTKYFSC